MIKKDYQKPTMKVVLLQQRTHLLQPSGPDTLSGKKGDGGDPDTWYELE